MRKWIDKLLTWIKSKILLVQPGPTAFRGATMGLVLITALLYTFNMLALASDIKDPLLVVLPLLTAALVILLAFFMAWIIKLIYRIPRSYKLSLLICLPLLTVTFMVQKILVIYILFTASLIGAAVWVAARTGLGNLAVPKKVVFVLGLTLGTVGLIAGAYYYSLRGLEMEQFVNAARLNADQIPAIPGESPSKKGSFSVKMLTYGSGTDKRRPEFGKRVSIETDPVNGVAFLDNWSGIAGWWREKYWGFDPKSLPLNARVWYPEGNGPFPLVLIVHGNHSMTDFSDIGYNYLGEMLASQGMIVASVDENFINSNWTNIFGGLEKENDARGWLLLEHLKVWHGWNKATEHVFFEKVDTDRIALIGHSRGGEAVVHAAMLNQLGFYPDDASIALNYNFNINALVAIAPVDGQYQPGQTLNRIKDINYLVLHGAQDADVTSYMGSMKFERISFEDSSYHFKAGLYIYGANHGQFNNSWGENDYGLPFQGLFNLGQLMTEGDQQEIAKVYISAFLKTTLEGKAEYLPLFADSRSGRGWLPETVYMNQFEDSNTSYIATYDEDFDVLSATLDAVSLEGYKLTIWREGEIQLKNNKKGSRAVFLGWDYTDINSDTSASIPFRSWITDSLIATYAIKKEIGSFPVDSTSVLVFSMAESRESTNPKSEGKWVDLEDSQNRISTEDRNNTNSPKMPTEEKQDREQKQQPLDMTIELKDLNGMRIRFPLSKFSALQREIDVRIWKMDFLLGDKQSEKVFQKFLFPLSELKDLNKDFTLHDLNEIRFIFDQSEKGVVVLDQVGFMKELKLVDTAIRPYRKD